MSAALISTGKVFQGCSRQILCQQISLSNGHSNWPKCHVPSLFSGCVGDTGTFIAFIFLIPWCYGHLIAGSCSPGLDLALIPNSRMEKGSNRTHLKICRCPGQDNPMHLGTQFYRAAPGTNMRPRSIWGSPIQEGPGCTGVSPAWHHVGTWLSVAGLEHTAQEVTT